MNTQQTDFVNLELDKEGLRKIGDKLQNMEVPNSFTMSRTIARSQHRKGVSEGRKSPKAVQLELFEDLSPKEREVAVPVSGETTSILNEVLSTLPTSGLTGKVLIALGQTIYEQSLNFKNEGTDYTQTITTKSGKEKEVLFPPMRGINETALAYFPKIKGVPSPLKDGKTLPIILVDITEFTKLVNGRRGESYTPSGKERNEIKDILEELRSREVVMAINGKRLSIPLINLLWKAEGTKSSKDDIGSKGIWALSVSPLFYEGIINDYIQFRADTLKALKGNQSEMTMRLLWLLIEFKSYGKGYTYTRKRGELFEEIAVLKRYKDHKKARDDDFKKAIETMKSLKLLSSYSEKEGANGDILSVFKINKDYLTA